MRKIIVSEMISLDGYFARPNGDIDWHIVNDEFNELAINLLNSIDILLFGRVTYQLFESYWPTVEEDPQKITDDMTIAHHINTKQKIVFSKSLKKVDWQNSQLKNEVNVEEIKKLKNQSGKDIVIYGSGTIVNTLASKGLIDEYYFFIAPVVLGEGKQLFKNLTQRLNLKLLSEKTLSNGVVAMRYSA